MTKNATATKKAQGAILVYVEPLVIRAAKLAQQLNYHYRIEPVQAQAIARVMAVQTPIKN